MLIFFYYFPEFCTFIYSTYVNQQLTLVTVFYIKTANRKPKNKINRLSLDIC